MIVTKGPEIPPHIGRLDGIEPGEEIILYFRKKDEDEGGRVKIFEEHMKLIKKYRTFALLENQKGLRECFNYQEIKDRANRKNYDY